MVKRQDKKHNLYFVTEQLTVHSVINLVLIIKMNRIKHPSTVLLLFISFSLNTIDCSDTFNEELVIKPIATGHLNAYFQFTTNWLVKNQENCMYTPKWFVSRIHCFVLINVINSHVTFTVHHTNLVARPIAEIFSKYDLKELHLSLTHGLWRYENWGYPPGK